MYIKPEKTGYTTNPDIFGPALWFTLHNSAVNYPNRPTNIAKKSMKQLIQNLSNLIPCKNCKVHFQEYVNASDLDYAVANRENLFQFWVSVHNYVNERTNKPLMSLETAKNLYGFYKPETGAAMCIYYN